MVTNLGILGFFKYFNFFIDSFRDLLQAVFCLNVPVGNIDFILPVGISFYTFQTMSYTIDIYRREMKATRNFPSFALFVSFFPQLVAGPIERAKSLLPQVMSKRLVTLDKFYEGCYLSFWGIFKKVFIADNLAKYIVNPAFATDSIPSGGVALIGIYAFAFQIYCDFSGYSDIARGCAKCLGFDIMVNFRLPYFSKNPQEFWRRWHISLSSWLKDYLYIPLGGNRKGTLNTYRNLMITMVLGGLWHGAAWTFVIWGIYHGVLLTVHRFFKQYLESIHPQNVVSRSLWFFLRVFLMFQLTCLGWLIFRAQSMNQVATILRNILFDFVLTSQALEWIGIFFFLLWLLWTIQIFQYWKDDLLFPLKINVALRTVFYTVCLYSIIIFGNFGGNEFIYFQF